MMQDVAHTGDGHRCGHPQLDPVNQDSRVSVKLQSQTDQAYTGLQITCSTKARSFVDRKVLASLCMGRQDS